MVKIRKKGRKTHIIRKNLQENLHIWKNCSTFALAFETRHLQTSCLYRGVEQLVARQAHNLEVIRSSRISATIPAGILLHRDSGFFVIRCQYASPAAGMAEAQCCFSGRICVFFTSRRTNDELSEPMAGISPRMRITNSWYAFMLWTYIFSRKS